MTDDLTGAALPLVPSLVDPARAAMLRQRMDEKTKPLGALGALEALAVQLGLILGDEAAALHSPQLVIFAADHGLSARGVSAYPREVTAQMVDNFLSGGAAASVLARQHGLALTVVDCGVARPLSARPGLVDRKVGLGTRDALEGPAMDGRQLDAALRAGVEVLAGLPGRALLLGEMGIGNTSAAAMLMSRLLDLDISRCAGAGTGLDADGVSRKVDVLRAVLARHASARSPTEALGAFGGFEIAAMVGAIIQAAAERRVIVVDGFIATAAALVAARLRPAVLERCVFAHRSDERGHRLLLERLEASPLLDLQLRLGEGSGAALAWPLVVSAWALLHEMASFSAAGVSTAQPPRPQG